MDLKFLFKISSFSAICIGKTDSFKMMLYSFLGALCLVMLSSDVEARLLNPSIVWKKLTESHLIKSNAVKHMAIDELDSFGSPFLLRGRPMPMGIQVGVEMIINTSAFMRE